MNNHQHENWKRQAPLIEPYKLFSSINNNAIPILFMKWIVRGSMTYLITGDQGSGKTTSFKSFVRFYDPSAALRVNELQPEMNLRYAYPDRNIISFAETTYMSTQDGLNFQKKTSGTYNLIGEIASAEAAAWWVQTTKVASKAGAGTHHGKTVYDTVTALASNLAQVTGSSDIKAMERTVAEALDFDMHMDREEGFRYCERISEVQVIKEEAYPFENLMNIDIDTIDINSLPCIDGKGFLDYAVLINQMEFQKRMTDRRTFTWKNLCSYDKERNMYVLDNMISDNYICAIKKNVGKELFEEFERDMDYIEKINKEAYCSRMRV